MIRTSESGPRNLRSKRVLYQIRFSSSPSESFTHEKQTLSQVICSRWSTVPAHMSCPMGYKSADDTAATEAQGFRDVDARITKTMISELIHEFEWCMSWLQIGSCAGVPTQSAER
jgi:hypothetical protein